MCLLQSQLTKKKEIKYKIITILALCRLSHSPDRYLTSNNNIKIKTPKHLNVG